MSTNPYQEAYELIAEQTEVSAKLNILTARNNELTAKIESHCISSGRKKSLTDTDLYHREKPGKREPLSSTRSKPFPLKSCLSPGKYVMPAVDIEWTEEQREKYLPEL